MVPQFNGGAYNPNIPNNGNPNTVYNRAVPEFTDPAIPYTPADYEYLGGGRVPEPVQPQFGEQAFKPTAAVAPATPMIKPQAAGMATPTPQLTAAMPKPTASWAKPRVPEPMAQAQPAQREMVSYGGVTMPRVTDTNADARSPWAITLPTIEAGAPSLAPTQFGTGADYWQSRLQSLSSTLPTIPIPGVGAPAQPTQPVGPGTGPANPTQPSQPVRPIFGTTVPDESGIIRGPDPIDYGRRGGGNVGRLLGLSGSLGVSRDQIASAYNNMTPDQQRQADADAEKMDDPAATDEEKQSAGSRLRQLIASLARGVMNFGRAINEFENRVDSGINRGLENAINWLTDDPSRFRDVSGLTGTVGPIQGDKGPTGGASGGRGKPTDPSAQKPGSRIPRKPT